MKIIGSRPLDDYGRLVLPYQLWRDIDYKIGDYVEFFSYNGTVVIMPSGFCHFSRCFFCHLVGCGFSVKGINVCEGCLGEMREEIRTI